MMPQICGYLLVLVAQYAVSTAPVGAPESIELFHPEMPPAPASSPANEKEAVPVIHLSTDENGKASVDAYLDMFPQEFLSNKRVRPTYVRKIEHEDFIDYEIEFLEVSDEVDEDDKNILSETGLSFNKTIVDMLSTRSSVERNNPSISSKLSEDPKEMNLVTFVDLLRRARIRHQSKISSDKRRRRRIKLKRDPVINIPTDTNDSSNQIETSQDTKLEQNSHSKIKSFPKPRELIRKIHPQESSRNSGNSGHRRISLPRYNNLRGRKRIPIKSGRKFSRDDRPSYQLTKARNPLIISKSGRFGTERATSTSTSSENLYTNSKKQEENDESIVTRNVTSTRFVTSASSFPILTSTTQFLEDATEKSFDEETMESEEHYKNMAATKEQMSQTTGFMVNAKSTTTPKITTTTTPKTTSTTTPKTTSTPTPKATSTSSTPTTASTIQLKRTNYPMKLPTLTTTIKPIDITTRQSLTSTTIMMYPEEFKDKEFYEVEQEFEELPIETISRPFSLFSLFSGRPKSSPLKIAPPSSYRQSQTKSSKANIEIPFKYKEINSFQRKETSPNNKAEKTLTTTDQLLQTTATFTVTSASRFSIISTSTQTSIPLHETTTTSKPIEDKLRGESFESFKADAVIEKTTIDDGHQWSTERSVLLNRKFSTTISVPTEVPTTETDLPDLSRTTPGPNWVRNNTMTETKNEYTRNKNNMQNEYKYQEVMTSTNMGSITNDNHQVSTPSSPNNSAAALLDDLQLSESITSVYLHNSPTSPTLTNNIETTENPKTESGNSIMLMPYSKLANHMQETRKKLTTEQSITENIFTVTPQYLSSTSPSTTKTTTTVMKEEQSEVNTPTVGSTTELSETIRPTTQISDVPLETLYSGQYHEINPGQYHEISPGQYYEQSPGQYEELHPGQYNELHPDQPGQYHNFEKSYSRDYEVNDVKVDFDHQDEHKIYNVQAKAGDFIIGEVGRIDINNGQTLEGVRYTALEGEVDPLRISQILERFFGTRTGRS